LTIKFTRHTPDHSGTRRVNSTSPACSSRESGLRCQVTGLRKSLEPITDR
jgi:hypothetical protein